VPYRALLGMQGKQRSVDYYKTPGGKEPAKEWLSSLKDVMTQAILYKRIRQAGLGQFGKSKNLGSGVWELKIDYGPGYRVYYGIEGDELILILMGGSKRTQASDIKKAKVYWIEWKARNI
jgi:putative addiction module killer protein